MVIFGLLLLVAVLISAPVALLYGASAMESEDTASTLGAREWRSPVR